MKKIIFLFLFLNISLYSFEIGMGVHSYLDEKDFIKMESSNIKFIRVDVDWASIEKEKDTYNFKKLDRIIKLSKKYNIKLLFIINYSNPLYLPNHLKNKKNIFFPYMESHYKKFLNIIFKKYASEVTFWEVWNEPNAKNFWIHSKEEYLYLLKITKQISKKYSNIKLVAGALAWKDNLEWGKYILKEGYSYFDILSIHTYYAAKGYLRDLKYKSIISQFTNLCKQHNKKCWITEIGLATAGRDLYKPEKIGFSPYVQSQALFYRILYARKSGIDNIFIYEWKDKCYNGSNIKCNYGLNFFNGDKKPAYNILKYIPNIREFHFDNLDDLHFKYNHKIYKLESVKNKNFTLMYQLYKKDELNTYKKTNLLKEFK